MKRTGIAIVVACMAWAGLGGGALADIQAGVDAYKAGDYKRAIDEWMPAAAQNNPTALFNLGQVYRLGKGVEPDFAVAEDYYKRAAALGHVAAEGNLAALYLDPDGSLFDPKKGVAWLQKAADHGNTLSRYMLGVIYFNGQYVPMDYVEAYVWISLASAEGLPDAMKAEQTIVSQMSLQQIATAKLRAEAIAKGSEEIATGEATEETSEEPAPESEDGTAEAPPEPVRQAAVDQKTGAWIDPDKAPEAQNAESSTPAPSVATTTAVTPISGFGIQLASLKSEDGAQATWKTLVAAHPELLSGLTPHIERADLGDKGVFYRLQAGSFSSLTDAKGLCGQLKDLKVGCLPISR